MTGPRWRIADILWLTLAVAILAALARLAPPWVGQPPRPATDTACGALAGLLAVAFCLVCPSAPPGQAVAGPPKPSPLPRGTGLRLVVFALAGFSAGVGRRGHMTAVLCTWAGLAIGGVAGLRLRRRGTGARWRLRGRALALVRLAAWAAAAAPGVFVLGLTAAFLADELTHRPGPGDRPVSGRVVRRDYVRHWTGARRPRLWVRLPGGGAMVRAELVNDPIDALPDAVTFYYRGDPRAEVRLLEERGNAAEMLALCGVTAGLYGCLILMWRRHRSREEAEAKPALLEAVIQK